MLMLQSTNIVKLKLSVVAKLHFTLELSDDTDKEFVNHYLNSRQ